MKASVKFRDDRRPLVRAKIPITVLGLPFVSGVAAGDSASELRLDLSTAFVAGPSIRLSYCPNDALKPFSVSIKTGFGNLGSPVAAPFAMSAQFSLLPSSSPSFSLVFKPSLGDFTVKKSLTSVAAPVVPDLVDKYRKDNGFVSPAVNLVDDVGKVRQENGFPMDITSAVNSMNSAIGGGSYGLAGLFSGFEVNARSVLPVRDRANVKLRWGVRVPAELRNAFEDSNGGFSFSKLPLLVMSKISIEHVPADKRVKEKKGDVAGTELADACGSVKQQLEALRVENGMLRRSVELLREEVGGWKSIGIGTPVAREVDIGRSKQSVSSNVGGKRDYRNDVKSSSGTSDKTPHGNDNVSEELKKALMKASGGQ